MGYVDKNLMPAEKVVCSTNHHWIIFCWPVILAMMVAFICVLFTSFDKYNLTSFFFTWIIYSSLIGPLFILPALVLRLTSEFAVTDRRVIMKTGWIRRNTFELMVPKVEGVQVDQNILARLLNYGSIRVSGTGGGSDPFNDISCPMQFRESVYRAIDESQNTVQKGKES